MPSPNNVLTADSYVQEGLVFQLDGIDCGGIDGQWIDRKNKHVFEMVGNLTPTDKYWSFNGQTYGTCADSLNFPYSSYSLEVTLRLNSITSDFYGIFSTKIAGNLSLGKNYKQFTTAAGVAVKQIKVSRQLNILYFDSNKAIINAITAAYVGEDQSPIDSKVRIGWNDKRGNPFIGRIYSIRVYSKKLSDREILINQKIDNARFGLGLNIPDEVLPANRSLSLSEPFELPDESMTEQDITNETSDER